MNADDFGFTHDVNEGIVEAYSRGIVRSTSLMANGAAFRDAVCRSRQHPGLGVGCHLTLVQGESVACPGTKLPASLAQLLTAFPEREEIVREFDAQVAKLTAHGIRPTHLDTHKHLHLLPPVLDAVLQVARARGIRWLRKPIDIPLGIVRKHRTWLARAIRPLKIPFEDRLGRAGCSTTDYFVGFAATGALDASWLGGLLRALPDGIGEFVCHPGRCGPELAGSATKLKESREAELEALCSPEVRRAVHAEGIALASFRDVGGS